MAAAAALARLEQKQPRARGPTSQDSIRNQGEFCSKWHLGWAESNGKGSTEGSYGCHVAGDTIGSCLNGDLDKTGTTLYFLEHWQGGLLALRAALPLPSVEGGEYGCTSGFRLGSLLCPYHTFLLSVRKELQAEATSSNNPGAPGTNSVRYLLGTAQCSGAVERLGRENLMHMSHTRGSGEETHPWKGGVTAMCLYVQPAIYKSLLSSIFRYLSPRRKSLPTWQCLVCSSSVHSQVSP